MAPSTIRKAIGAVKDRTSIGIAKVASNMAPEHEVAIVKATSHDDVPASEKYVREILQLTSYTRGYVSACVVVVYKRLGKTRDWIVALKCLMLIHRLLNDGDAVFQQEIMYANRRGAWLLNLSAFRDEAHSNSWDHSAFVRAYALYLNQRLEMMAYERKQSGNVRESARKRKDVTLLREMTPEKIFGKTSHLQRLLDWLLSCRPTGLAKNERMILDALYTIVKESFKLYADICEVLAVLLDKFYDMEYEDCVKAFDAYANSAKQINKLVGFYNWCKDIGDLRFFEYPEVLKITNKLLETLEEFVSDRAKALKSPKSKVDALPSPQEEVPVPDMNEIKALPAPENYTPAPPPEPETGLPKPAVQESGDLVDLSDEGVSADDQGYKFSGPVANNGNSSWEAFPSNGWPELTSAWQNPAAETGKVDWELALVESASPLSQQKAAMGSGLDPLLNSMHGQGMVRQHMSASQLSGGTSSCVTLPGPGASKTQVLVLPAPDRTVQTVGQDPFAASLSILPPSYVQMSDMEMKQQLVVQEPMVWQQYFRDGMQGQTSLSKINAGGYYPLGVQPVIPCGMPPVNGVGVPPSGYYYTPNPY